MAEGGMQQDERYTFFWKQGSPFSQWHKSKFTVDGILYFCCEQYMMHQKAVLFGDEEVAKMVMESSDPKKIKSFGRKVRNFDEDKWLANRVDIVKRGNMAKFSQNPKLKDVLFETAGTIIAEASPVDTIWGIGCAADNPKAQQKSTWRGQNLLGYILTDVRDELMCQEKTGS